ncbi:MAG: SO_0444 family Cu/Zn efflux transporter [Gammaproteobacteria bacterium]|nr:SO_0444 family Cu/Zn efflux transporter [Gammaproteobacteria bacterium]
MNDLSLLLTNFFALFMESAPWLLLGLLVAGIMHELVPVSLLQKHMGKNSIGAIVKSAFIGAPLPLCSCGVIPAALGLRRSGASKSATVSFLVSTPETGADSVSVSYALLGPVFAIVRPIAAITSAIYAGLMIKAFDTPDAPTTQSQAVSDLDKNECCSASSIPVVTDCCNNSNVDTTAANCCDKMQTADQSSCCSSPTATSTTDCYSSQTPPEMTSCCDSASMKIKIPSRLSAMFSYASGQLLNDITLWLLLGLALAAAIQTWVPISFLIQWGDGFIAMLVMALIGIPMYICATASTPLAVGFLAAGLSPGAILVFLLAGPATNISTMGMINRELGQRSLGLYLFSILSASIGLGYLLNLLVNNMGWQMFIPTGEAMHLHAENIDTLYVLSAIVLAGLIMRNGWLSFHKKRYLASH